MARSTRYVAKKNDAELAAFFIEAAKLLAAESCTLEVAGHDRTISLLINDPAPELKWIFTSTLHTIDMISTGISRVSLSIDRRPEVHKENQVDLALVDVLVFNANPDHTGGPAALSPELAQKVNKLIDVTFGVDVNFASLAFKDPKSLQTVLRSHQQIIERLQKMTLEVGEQAANTRRELDEEYLALKKQLEGQVAEERLEQQRSADEERAELKARADELAARARELDDRNNTHVRRELFEKTRALLSERFKKLALTPETKKARAPIHVGVFATSVILAVLIYHFTNEALAITAKAESTAAERILVIAKSATASLGFLGVISWYLRWMNRWFERLADSEFHMKQFELDITRAQWVVETAFEWKMSQQTPIPDHLLESVSRNLFADPKKDEGADMHPADYLASALIGKASNVKLAVPGAEIELGPKALKDAAKAK